MRSTAAPEFTTDESINLRILRKKMLSSLPSFADVPVNLIATAMIETYLATRREETWKLGIVNGALDLSKLDAVALKKVETCGRLLVEIGKCEKNHDWKLLIEHLDALEKIEQADHDALYLPHRIVNTMLLQSVLRAIRSYLITALEKNELFQASLQTEIKKIENDEITDFKAKLTALEEPKQKLVILQHAQVEEPDAFTGDQIRDTGKDKEAILAKIFGLNQELLKAQEKLKQVKDNLQIYSFEVLAKNKQDHITCFANTILPNDKTAKKFNEEATAANNDKLAEKTFDAYYANVLTGRRKIEVCPLVFDAYVAAHPEVAKTLWLTNKFTTSFAPEQVKDVAPTVVDAKQKLVVPVSSQPVAAAEPVAQPAQPTLFDSIFASKPAPAPVVAAKQAPAPTPAAKSIPVTIQTPSAKRPEPAKTTFFAGTTGATQPRANTYTPPAPVQKTVQRPPQKKDNDDDFNFGPTYRRR